MASTRSSSSRSPVPAVLWVEVITRDYTDLTGNDSRKDLLPYMADIYPASTDVSVADYIRTTDGWLRRSRMSAITRRTRYCCLQR